MCRLLNTKHLLKKKKNAKETPAAQKACKGSISYEFTGSSTCSGKLSQTGFTVYGIPIVWPYFVQLRVLSAAQILLPLLLDPQLLLPHFKLRTGGAAHESKPESTRRCRETRGAVLKVRKRSRSSVKLSWHMQLFHEFSNDVVIHWHSMAHCIFTFPFYIVLSKVTVSVSGLEGGREEIKPDSPHLDLTSVHPTGIYFFYFFFSLLK